ncbi:hypothetical protein FDECE_17836 [Fusarium decemcellulare]|nr:hypothetical protein FDECE_17836 [Fusarium decemcellulare]
MGVVVGASQRQRLRRVVDWSWARGAASTSSGGLHMDIDGRSGQRRFLRDGGGHGCAVSQPDQQQDYLRDSYGSSGQGAAHGPVGRVPGGLDSVGQSNQGASGKAQNQSQVRIVVQGIETGASPASNDRERQGEVRSDKAREDRR